MCKKYYSLVWHILNIYIVKFELLVLMPTNSAPNLFNKNFSGCENKISPATNWGLLNELSLKQIIITILYDDYNIKELSY